MTLPLDVAAAVNGAQARTQALRLDVRWFATVTSTMDVAAEAVEAGAAEGLVIGAEEQTAGRGRRGRIWASPPGAGLYLSFVLRPRAQSDAAALALMTLAAGVAIREAIARGTGLVPHLKWPNDVVIGHRKLAGILAEGLAISGPDQAIVLGVGINVLRSAYPSEIEVRATSLESELGRVVDRGVLLEEVLVALSGMYGRLRANDTDGILRAWRAAAPSASGARVQLPNGARGVTVGIDDSGALLVRVGDRTERVIGGELTWK